MAYEDLEARLTITGAPVAARMCGLGGHPLRDGETFAPRYRVEEQTVGGHIVTVGVCKHCSDNLDYYGIVRLADARAILELYGGY